ncbi:MAG TPA: NIPSNAP family protein [Vicinamibacterales bacterium]
MFRRNFLSLFPMLPAMAAGQAAPTGGGAAGPLLYEWRQFSMRTGPAGRRLDDYLQAALIPALNRLGHAPVGVFQVTFGLPTPTTCVLTPFASADGLVRRDAALDADAEYVRAAAAYLDAAAGDPAYVRQEVSILSAFPQFPAIAVPAATASKGARIFELRTYESPGERAHRAKVKMFAEMGEIDIFKRVGFAPVFFAHTLAGPRMPSLVYMLTHENLAARDRNWAAFAGDADWAKLRQTPGYSDAEIVSNITDILLRPAAYSQI